LLLIATASVAPLSAHDMVQPSVTPDLTTLPLNHFRIDFGMLGVTNVVSRRSNREGNLWASYLSISFGAAANAVLSVEGMAYKTFAPERGTGSAGVGDFTVWGKFLLGTPHQGTGYGVQFGAKLPNTPSNKDFGTNQTDFFMFAFAGTQVHDWQLSAFAGLGILDRPLEQSQDDVAMAGVLARKQVGPGLLRLEIEGFTKSQLYGNNWAFHLTYERPIAERLSYLVAGQLSKGRLNGNRELRAGLVFTP
jgi:hypothetical protein